MGKNSTYIKPVVAGEEKLTTEETKPQVEETTEEAPAGTIAPSATSSVGETVQPDELAVAKVVKQENSGITTPTSEITMLLDRVNATGNQVVINSMNSIQQYMVDMGPTMTQTSESGARHQVILFRAIRTIIDFAGNDFQLTFSTLLRLFDENKNGVFSDRYVFRFTESIVMNTEERRAFERILNLIKVTADPAGRKEAVNQINFQKALQYVFTEEGKRRVLAFFNK